MKICLLATQNSCHFLNNPDANTTGNIEPLQLQNFQNASDINTAYLSSEISGLGDEDITIST